MNKDLTQDERRDWAQSLFMTTDESIPDIALKTNVDVDLLRDWIRENKWQATRRSRLTSKASQLEMLYNTLATLHEKTAEPKNADQVLKYTAAIRNLEMETSVSDIIEVSELFVKWLRRRDHALTQKIVLYFDGFIKERLED